MPVQYGGILEEVAQVRARSGLFDLGHMGRVAIRGAGAEAYLQRLQTNDARAITAGGIRYALILDPAGLTQDDILVYREPADDGFFVVVNAGNREHDLDIMAKTAEGFEDVTIEDQTDQLGMIAIQGPLAAEITQRLADIPLADLKYYHWARGSVCDVPAGLSRTGYTGEDGFEVYAEQRYIADIWNAFLEAGGEDGCRPIGLAARDILRLEAGMALYGHEIDRTTNPLEAGLSWAVKFNHEFTGRRALEELRERGGTGRKLVGLTTNSRRVPRQGYTLFDGDRDIGSVCSGGTSPTLGVNIGTAYVSEDAAEAGKTIEFAVRDKREPATVTTLPFYKRKRN